MTLPCHEAIARDAWVVYKKALNIQETMLNSFLDDFMEFEKQERNMKMIQEEELPF
jgi:hypothetical protein